MNEPPPATAADSLSTRVVEAVADAVGTDPLDLEPPLYYAIDLDALERLVGEGSTKLVRFEYVDRTVTVRGDGTVLVDGDVYGC